MQTERSFREWIGRWFATQWVPQVSEVVQPVALVDDVSSLQLPPVIKVWGIHKSQSGVAAQRTLFYIHPRSKPILLLDMFVTGNDPQYGVRDTESPVLGVNTIGQLVAGPVGTNATGHDALFQSGTTATTPWAQSPPRFDADTLIDIGVLVLPGQFFYIRSSSDNVTVTIKMLRWIEFEDVETLTTSNPRGG